MSSSAADLANGLVARSLGWSAEQAERAAEVLARVEADGLETVRLLFADQHGVLRGKTVVARALASAFKAGVTSPSSLLLKDTSHRTVFPIWSEDAGFGAGAMTGAGDVLLAPDPATFRTLPWSPKSGWMLCDVIGRDGAAFDFASRTLLKNAIGKLGAAGYEMVCGLEIEFHVFRVVNANLEHVQGGMPGAAPETAPLNHGYQLLTDDYYDGVEEVMDLLRRNAEALGLPVRSMEAEFGPSQFEFTFDPASPLAHADATVLFRSMVKQICARRGLHATFMCRPKVENGAASGWHLHQSLVDRTSGANLFTPNADGSLSATASGWIAGLLEHAAESCLLTTPTVNGYKRYQAFQLAPDRIQWARDNKGAMIRGLMVPGDPASRIENRVAEPAANPYYYFASQILGGLDGVQRGLVAPAPADTPYNSDAERLPASLIAAIEAFEQGALFRSAVGEGFVSYLSRIKRAEWERYLMTVSEWEQREYFTLL